MGIIHLLSIMKAALCKIVSLCSLAWIMPAISLGKDSSTEENMQRPIIKQENLNSDGEELREVLRQIKDISTSSLSRQYRYEEKVEMLQSDLIGEKELWRTRYQELLLDQQALKDQQEKCYPLKEYKKPEHLVPPFVDVTDGILEPGKDIRDGLHRRLGDKVKICAHDYSNLTLIDGYNSLEQPLISNLPIPSSPVNFPGSTNSCATHKCFRVFAPRSPFDLKVGNRVKVILPSGRIGIGAVCKVRQLPGKVEFHVGVDLEPPNYWQQGGVFKGQHNFNSDPGSGVSVPFSKVLMVWE
ncbi:uncharacterized protein LOC135035683 isoform X2 [Pseudophryne corroboree]|uniref:uncharacterized protein LOC135035683 isoform X2 n=1 Tax=Pseudophryne corroboree TaxID=495146 RepID=UPI0030812667